MTAVDNLREQLKTILPKSMFEDVVIQDCFIQAKRIEKQQTERDFLEGYKLGLKPINHDIIDNYYKKTYTNDANTQL